MLGLSDFWIWSVYLLCFLAAAVCVIAGLVRWNADGDETPDADDLSWSSEEKKVDDAL